MTNRSSGDDVAPTMASLTPDDPMFLVIHTSALLSLAISIVVSAATLVYMIATGNTSLTKRRIGERLVIYLAICDLLYSIEHTSNHILTMVNGGLPDDISCAISAFFLQEFFSAQSFIVLFSALSAFLLVTRGVKLPFGKFDWILLVLSFGIPAFLGIVFASLGLLGPNGYWCLADMRQYGGVIVYNIYAAVMFLVSFLDIVLYLGVWQKISATRRRLRSCSTESGDLFKYKKGKMVSVDDQKRYNKTAQVLTLFVLAYLMQWWSFIVYALWAYITTPPLVLIELMVIFCNLGGVFNCIAYTLVRKSHRPVTGTGTRSKETKSSSLSMRNQNSSERTNKGKDEIEIQESSASEVTK